ncbi:MAG: CAP domain-containing protein [Candidatus Nitrosocaldus sp.]|nr:CAP domain-containing protein [Candidatus Nitrosocaldus sp.]MDW8275888.1 CAP domain-containing protein [Candidatus Nitrosocaldus sp.]
MRTLLAVCIAVWTLLGVFLLLDISKEFAFADIHKFEDSIVDATNKVRAEHGLPSLVKDAMLTENAKRYAIVNADKGFISHNHEPLTSRMPSSCISIGENLYQGRDGSGEGIVNAWMRSPAHRENILDAEWERIGVGVARIGSQIVAVQLFCR